MKSYSIELSEKNAEILMMKYNCRTDAELRNILQVIINSHLALPRDLILELADKKAMQGR